MRREEDTILMDISATYRFPDGPSSPNWFTLRTRRTGDDTYAALRRAVRAAQDSTHGEVPVARFRASAWL